MLSLVLYLTFFDANRIPKLCISLLCSLFIGFRLNLVISSEQCPECYGDELCRFFQNSQIQLIWSSRFLSLLNSKWTKSVFHGYFNGSRVVIKRKVGRVGGNYSPDDVDPARNETEAVIFCPSITNKLFLIDKIKEEIGCKRLWLDVKTSIEPLLLMYFQSGGTWPCPEYLGACGEFIVEEYKGKPLNSFLFSHFSTRARLAVHLLKMANLFTFAHPELAFYFIDYSLDNMAVDSNGSVFLIDLDSVIISNKSAFSGDDFKRNAHRSEILDDYKYAFSPLDICSHYLSDHNYFSVCKYLLSHLEEGLLKDIPTEIKRREELLYLLNECTLPVKSGDRFSAGQQLLLLLEEISQEES